MSPNHRLGILSVAGLALMVLYLETTVESQKRDLDALRAANRSLASPFVDMSACPAAPTVVDLRIGVMSSPKIRVAKSVDRPTRLAIARSARPWIVDAATRRLIAHSDWPWKIDDASRVAVDIAQWPFPCRRLSVRRRPGDAPHVQWLPSGCDAQRPRPYGVTTFHQYGFRDERRIVVR